MRRAARKERETKIPRADLAKRALAICTLLLVWATSAGAAASLVRKIETWTGNERGVENPTGVAYIPATESGGSRFLISDLSYRPDQEFNGSRLAGVDLDLRPTAHGVDLPSTIREPSGLTYHPMRKTLFVTDDDEVALYEIDLRGRLLRSIDLSEVGASDPEGVALDPMGDRLFIADGRAQQILELTIDGELIRTFDVQDIPGFREAEGITYDPRSDHLYVAAGKAGLLFELNRDGSLVAAFDLSVLGASRPRGVALLPSADPSGPADSIHLLIVDDVGKKQPGGRLLEIALTRRPARAHFVSSLVGDVDGFGFDGSDPGFARGDTDHNGLLERGEQLPESVLGASPAVDKRSDADAPNTDAMLVSREGRPVSIDHTIDLPAALRGAAPVWARLTLLVADARTLARHRSAVRIDGRRIGEVVGSSQKKLLAGAIASTVIELPPAALESLADGRVRIEISRDPGTGSDDIMIDYSRLEMAFAR